MYLQSNTTYNNFYIYTVNIVAAASTNSNKNVADIASYISSVKLKRWLKSLAVYTGQNRKP